MACAAAPSQTHAQGGGSVEPRTTLMLQSESAAAPEAAAACDDVGVDGNAAEAGAGDASAGGGFSFFAGGGGTAAAAAAHPFYDGDGGGGGGDGGAAAAWRAAISGEGAGAGACVGTDAGAGGDGDDDAHRLAPLFAPRQHAAAAELFPAEACARAAQRRVIAVGDYGAKVDALVRCIRALRCADEAGGGGGGAAAAAAAAPRRRRTQSLVFSQSAAALAIVAHALSANGVRALRVKSAADTARAVAAFASDDDVAALLMRFAAGAEGLNLTTANHVFLLEPLLDAGAEAQAVGRVFRMGQTRQTYVHRLIARGTVDEAVLAVTEPLRAAVAAAAALPPPPADAEGQGRWLDDLAAAQVAAGAQEPAAPAAEGSGEAAPAAATLARSVASGDAAAAGGLTRAAVLRLLGGFFE